MLPSEAGKKRLEILRMIFSEKRMKIALNLNDLVYKMMKDGIRNQYPSASNEEFNRKFSG